MQESYERRKRRINVKKIKRFFALVACVYFAITVVRLVYTQETYKARQREEFESLTDQIQEIEQSNEELRRKIEYAQSSSYIERYARDQLGYVKEGEIKFVAGGTMGLEGPYDGGGQDPVEELVPNTSPAEDAEPYDDEGASQE
jgi:cell division protein FtsB/cell division protein DivIC